jgi:hypothetical protein
MMKYRKAYMVLIGGIVISNAAIGQSNDSVKKWSIELCVKYASAHNIQVSTLRLSELYAAQDLYLAKGAKIPSLYGTRGQYIQQRQ